MNAVTLFGRILHILHERICRLSQYFITIRIFSYIKDKIWMFYQDMPLPNRYRRDILLFRHNDHNQHSLHTFNLSSCLCMASYPRCSMKGSTQSPVTLRTSTARSSRHAYRMGKQTVSSSRGNDLGGTGNDKRKF